MQASFNTSRIFNDQSGWYVIMRGSDVINLTGLRHKFIGDQHLMGPFINRHRVEQWLEDYLAMHSENRPPNTFILENDDNTRH